MKRILGCFILLVCSFFTKAQLASQAIHNKTAETLLKEYNAKNYKGIYKLLDKEFQKQMNEKELGDFFKFNVYQPYGDITTLTFIEFKNSYYLYLADCKNGKLDLNLSCNADGKINSMQWLPHREVLPEVPVLKSEGFNTDNPKATAWDLKVDSTVNIYLRNSANCGLSIAVYANKEVKYYNYGEVKRGTNQLPSGKTIYEIGSVSKTFTGILLAQAITDKKVNANDPVKKHLGEQYKNLAYKGKAVELVHLANHSSRTHRLPFDLMNQPGYDPLNPYAHYTKDMVLKYVAAMPIDTFPGIKSEYSNLGMGLLGIILEDAYKKTYEELITQYICQPLEMSDTKLVLNEEQRARFATGYNNSGGETPYWNLGGLPGAGGIRSTSEDMMKFLKANLAETNPAFKLSHYSTFNDGKDNIAMAWHLFITKKANELTWHNGRTAGFASFCGFIKSKDMGVVVLSNSGNPVDQIALGLLKLLQ